MRQHSSAAPQMKRTDIQNLFVSREEIDRCAKNILGLVEQRAYELFENRGREHGHDNEDWFQAESEVLRPVTIELGDPGEAYTAVAIVSGCRPENLKIGVEPRRLTICGMPNAGDTESGRPQENSQPFEYFFVSSTLPTEIDTAAVSADIRHDVLEVRLPKAVPHIESAE